MKCNTLSVLDSVCPLFFIPIFKNNISLFFVSASILFWASLFSNFSSFWIITSICPSVWSNPSTNTFGVSFPTRTVTLPVLISASTFKFLSNTSTNLVVELLPFINTILYFPFSTLVNSYLPSSSAVTTFKTLPPWINWTLAFLPLVIVPPIINFPSTTFIGLTTYSSSLKVTLCAGFK